MPRPHLYHSISGTSMATPHVAGVAALVAQSTGKRAVELWQALERRAAPLTGWSVQDVGKGLVQA